MCVSVCVRDQDGKYVKNLARRAISRVLFLIRRRRLFCPISRVSLSLSFFPRVADAVDLIKRSAEFTIGHMCIIYKIK